MNNLRCKHCKGKNFIFEGERVTKYCFYMINGKRQDEEIQDQSCKEGVMYCNGCNKEITEKDLEKDLVTCRGCNKEFDFVDEKGLCKSCSKLKEQTELIMKLSSLSQEDMFKELQNFGGLSGLESKLDTAIKTISKSKATAEEKPKAEVKETEKVEEVKPAKEVKEIKEPKSKAKTSKSKKKEETKPAVKQAEIFKPKEEVSDDDILDSYLGKDVFADLENEVKTEIKEEVKEVEEETKSESNEELEVDFTSVLKDEIDTDESKETETNDFDVDLAQDLQQALSHLDDMVF